MHEFKAEQIQASGVNILPPPPHSPQSRENYHPTLSQTYGPKSKVHGYITLQAYAGEIWNLRLTVTNCLGSDYSHH